MSNPFDDLDTDTDDDVETDSKSEPEVEPAVDNSAPEPEPEPTTPSTKSVTAPTAESEQDPTESGPAFEYSDVRQKPLYARDETWNSLEDEIGIEVTPALRRMGIRDEATREIHDVILEVAIGHIDEIPKRLAEKRRQRRLE